LGDPPVLETLDLSKLMRIIMFGFHFSTLLRGIRGIWRADSSIDFIDF
jgi:hypothetical protein